MGAMTTNRLDRLIADAQSVAKKEVLAVEGRACGFVVGVIVCALLVALLYFGLRWAFAGVPE